MVYVFIDAMSSFLSMLVFSFVISLSYSSRCFKCLCLLIPLTGLWTQCCVRVKLVFYSFYVYFAINIRIYSNRCYFWKTIFKFDFIGPVDSPIAYLNPSNRVPSSKEFPITPCRWHKSCSCRCLSFSLTPKVAHRTVLIFSAPHGSNCTGG